MPARKQNKARKAVLQSIETEESAIPVSTQSVKPSTEAAKPSSTEPAKPSATSNAQRKPYGQRLSEKDEILLFQLCIQHSLGFRSVKNHKQFWIKISGLFEQTAKRPYSWQSVKHKIEDLTLKRKAILEADETGTTQINEDPLSQVIDE